MQISTTGTFDAEPAAVFAMFTDPAFLTEVCIRGGANDYEVSVDDLTTRTRRTLTTPAAIRAIAGPTLAIAEEVQWGEARDDGGRAGRLHLSIEHHPIHLEGYTVLDSRGGGSHLTVAGDLVVSIPMFGRKIERAAAPLVVRGIEWQQRVGAEWLAQR